MSEAKKRKKEIEYRADIGQMIVPHCKTMKELLEEYVNLYGKEAWALSTYSSNVSMINNYINPIIGGDKLENVNTRFIEKYYQRLLRTPAVINPATGKRQSEYVTPATIRDIHKLLRNCFQQAVKWELMAKNPVIYATVPKYKSAKREIWTAETLMHALKVCEDDRLKLALNLAFSCSLRMGEMLGLTWDCVDISEEVIAENRAYIYVDKEVQRVDKAAIQELRGKDVILVFPEESKKNKTVRVLKLPKTESSIRKVFLPKSVAEMLVEWKKGQDKIKETLGDEYMDYNLVMATPFGLPIGTSSIVYSHIIDDDRRKNAKLFEQAFYEKKNLDPSMHANVAGKTVELPTNVDAKLLRRSFPIRRWQHFYLLWPSHWRVNKGKSTLFSFASKWQPRWRPIVLLDQT